MQFSYHKDIFQRFPTLVAGVAFVVGVKNSASDETTAALLAEQQAVISRTLESATLSAHPHIASWRAAYSAFGTKPARYNCAVELLLRRALKEGSVPKINLIVDICNYVSMKHVLPVAALDLDRIVAPIEVRFANGGEKFLPIYGSEPETAEPGEVIYADALEAISRRWNWRQCDKAKVTTATQRVLFTTEGINQVARTAVEKTLDELVKMVRERCGGEVFQFVLDRDTQVAMV